MDSLLANLLASPTCKVLQLKTQNIKIYHRYIIAT